MSELDISARRHERTAPIHMTAPSGATHAQLRALADGLGQPLTLARRYHLDRRIGRGGMATVFGGRDLVSGRAIAVKVLDDQLDFRDAGLDRFLAEARVLAELHDRNIVRVHDHGSTPTGIVYMVMDLLEGHDLHTLLERKGPLPRVRVQALMAEICAGLAAAHARGVVHRDLKPANVFVTAEGLELLDFGIAAPIAGSVADDRRQAWLGRHEGRRLTLTGQVVGTPEYMSPEQARGEEVDARSDVYSAGILLGELLTGTVPFRAKSRLAIIDAQVNETPPTLTQLAGHDSPTLRAFEPIYARALAKDPDARYPSIEAFAAAVAAAEPRWWQRPAQLLGAVARVAAMF